MSQPLTNTINALTAYANKITGKSDTTLSDAVKSLVDWYDGDGGEILITPQIQGKPLTTAITSLITYVNTVTGQSDQTLLGCITTLTAEWEYSYANGDFYLFENGNYASASSDRLIISNANNRWSFGLYNGIYPLKGGSDTVIVPNIFPVPIPPTATKVTITPTPSTMKCQGDLCTITEDGYTISVGTGWTSGTKVLTFTAGQYTHIAPKTQGTVTELTVKFEE